MATHNVLVDRNFYGPRMYKKRMMLCSSLIHFISQEKYTLDKIVVEQAGEDINQVRPIILEGMRKLKGLEEGPIQSWMKIHGASANIPSEIIEQAIDFLEKPNQRWWWLMMNSKHLHGSYLCVGQLISNLQ